MPTLLETAKSRGTKIPRCPTRSPRLPPSQEERELILAWLADEVGQSQVEAVTGRVGTTCYARAFSVLRDAYRKGELRIIKK